MIVDEALSVGDVAFKNKCIKKVNEIIHKNNVTLLFVTHATATARQFCKRGIVMKNGKIIYDDAIDSAIAIYEKNINA